MGILKTVSSSSELKEGVRNNSTPTEFLNQLSLLMNMRCEWSKRYLEEVRLLSEQLTSVEYSLRNFND